MQTWQRVDENTSARQSLLLLPLSRPTSIYWPVSSDIPKILPTLSHLPKLLRISFQWLLCPSSTEAKVMHITLRFWQPHLIYPQIQPGASLSSSSKYPAHFLQLIHLGSYDIPKKEILHIICPFIAELWSPFKQPGHCLSKPRLSARV